MKSVRTVIAVMQRESAGPYVVFSDPPLKGLYSETLEGFLKQEGIFDLKEVLEREIRERMNET